MYKLKFILKNEFGRYLLGGASITLFNAMLFTIFLYAMDYQLANLLAIVVAKIYGFLINKFFVYHSKTSSFKELSKEIGRYVLVRGSTGVLDYFGVIFLVEHVGFYPLPSKYAVMILIMAFNYIFGRLFVFKKVENA